MRVVVGCYPFNTKANSAQRFAALLSAGLGAENLQIKINYNGSRKFE